MTHHPFVNEGARSRRARLAAAPVELLERSGKCTVPSPFREALARISSQINADAIGFAFVHAARALNELHLLKLTPQTALSGSMAMRSRWIALAALRQVYGDDQVAFLTRPWALSHEIASYLRRYARASWWDDQLVSCIAAELRMRRPFLGLTQQV